MTALVPDLAEAARAAQHGADHHAHTCVAAVLAGWHDIATDHAAQSRAAQLEALQLWTETAQQYRTGGAT